MHNFSVVFLVKCYNYNGTKVDHLDKVVSSEEYVISDLVNIIYCAV